jgi:hypothetical protein
MALTELRRLHQILIQKPEMQNPLKRNASLFLWNEGEMNFPARHSLMTLNVCKQILDLRQ